MVIIVHVSNFFKLDTTMYFPKLFISILYDFRCGVTLFFIVSAYTLMLSYQRRIDEKNKTRNFFIRRFFRIAPIYYLAIIIISAHNIYLDPINIQSIKSFWFAGNLLFLNTLNPCIIGTIVPGGWSISVEFMFYLLFPFLVRIIKNANHSLIAFGISITIATVFYYIYQNDPLLSKFHFMELNFLYQVPIFFLGIFAFYIITDETHKIKNSTIFFCLPILIMFSYLPMPYYFMWSIAFVTILIIQSRNSYVILSNKVLSKIGQVSFSMYIIHFLVIIVLNNFNIGHLIPISGFGLSAVNYILLVGIVSSITYAISLITYKFIEIPGQNLGRKLIKKLDQQNNITV